MSSTFLDKQIKKQERLVNQLQELVLRPHFKGIKLSDRGDILIGPRGTGKTTYLISQTSLSDKCLYLSLDDLKILNENLFDLIEEAYNQGFRHFFLDEVHFYPQWSMVVKNVYDAFPKIKLTLSDSSSLILRQGNADLSRRFPKTHLPLLSFREFIFLKLNIELPIYNPIENYIQKKKLTLPAPLHSFIENENINKLFLDFIDFGQRPFFKEGKYQERIENIIEKTVYTDIPYFVPSLNENHIGTLKSILGHLATATIPTINIQSFCNQWEIGKDKVYELLKVLEASGLIQVIYNTETPKGTSKGDKILFQDCSFYNALGGNLGNRREAYFASSLSSAGYKVLTSKNEVEGDFRVKDILFEIGGKNKSIKKSDIVVKETLDQVYSKEWPLWIFGFLW
jgi:predicted AAA+ superfamily ATPase